MTYKSNKFKSITKELIGPNIIFPAVCVLLGADMCGISNTAGKVPIGYFGGSPASTQANGLKDSSRAKSDTLGVMSLLGRGTLLNLGDGYQCGIFVASETKEALIIKLPEDGRMQLVEQPQQGGQGRQTDILPARYDAVEKPRIIKVDDAVLEQLIKQSSSNENVSWRDIEFYYKEAISAIPIFTYNGITPSTEFTSVNNLTSNTLSMRGSVASTTFKELEKVGFVLVKKDTSGLIHLVKNILEGGTEWGTKAAVAETKGYITCPAAFVGDVLQFDSSDVELQPQNGLEDYKSTYCYLKDKDGEYYRLIELENVKSLVEKESAKKQYCWNQVVRVPEQSTAAIPPKESVDKNGSVILKSSPSEKEEQTKDLCISIGDTDGTKTDNLNEPLLLPDWTLQNSAHKNDGYHNGVNVGQTDSIINSPVEQPKVDEKHIQTVYTSSRQVISSQNSGPVQNQQPDFNGSGNGLISPPPSPLPMLTSTRPAVNDIPPPPPLLTGSAPPPSPPPLPTEEDFRGISGNNMPPSGKVTTGNNNPTGVQSQEGRTELLASIRKGVKLKPTQLENRSKATKPTTDNMGVASILARRPAMELSDDDDATTKEDSSDNDDWAA